MNELIEEQIENDALFTVKTISSKLIFHSFDFLRIYFTIQFLTARYADQAFNEIARYGAKPAVDADHYRKTNGPIMLASALLAVMIKCVNAYYSEKNNRYLASQDYVYALFSSSVIFFLGDLFSSTGQMPALSAFSFTIISLVGVLAMMAVFLKITTPISTDKMIFEKNPSTEISYFDEYAAPLENPSKTVRILNALGSVGYVASLSTFFWVLNHEIHDGVWPLAVWQQVVLGLGAVGLASYGSLTVTDHPKYYLLFLMGVILLNMGAISYAGVSSLLCYISCQNHHNTGLIIANFFIALATGLFSASHIEFRIEDKHAANQKTEEMIEKISDKIVSLFHRCKVCCKKEVNDVDQVELTQVTYVDPSSREYDLVTL